MIDSKRNWSRRTTRLSELTSMSQESKKIDEEEFDSIVGFDMFERKYNTEKL